ncbi:GIY-YIG nuclease family protein [Escherichia coli]|nr:GIY-YIG nuclease family protein [Escherichia coli]
MKSTTTYLYVMEYGAYVKIGISNSPDTRLLGLRKMMDSDKLNIILTVEYPTREDALNAEKYAHLVLKRCNVRMTDKNDNVIKFDGYTEFFKVNRETKSYIKEMLETECSQGVSFARHPITEYALKNFDYDFLIEMSDWECDRDVEYEQWLEAET